ncbi:hypothetical protein PG994_003757 [Apiospora phragmitis]|uniref:Uncharacterized protein n=1 Tax=Apiospora phragmitis TaxID=2905665 RepID=A0ABR1VZ05_9PEZI
MSGITKKPLNKPQLKRPGPSLSPAAVKSMKIDLSLFDAENEGYCCTHPNNKRDLSRLSSSNQANQTSRQRKGTSRGPQRRYGRRCCIGDDDGLSLACSDVPLPGDGCRDNNNKNNKFTPRLEHQEAFRGPAVGGGFVSSDDVVENDADLYRLGLLYDDDADEGNRGSHFNLNAIVHDEPVYAVSLSRRKQKRGKNSARMYSPGPPLHVIYESVEDSLYRRTHFRWKITVLATKRMGRIGLLFLF